MSSHDLPGDTLHSADTASLGFNSVIGTKVD